jgi:hypothetical protein
MENRDAAWNVTLALHTISNSDIGRQSCIDAGAISALTALGEQPVAKEDELLSVRVVLALKFLNEESGIVSHKHPLLQIYTSSSGRLCSVCRSNAIKMFYTCKECEYNECERCFDKNGGVAGDL